MKRTHLATAAVLEALLQEFGRVRAIAKKTERTAAMQTVAYATLAKWSLGGASAAAARVDAIGLVESYLQQLGDGRERASPPTIPPTDGRPAQYTEALLELAGTHAPLAREAELRDTPNRMARPGSPRPLSLHGYGHFYRLLRHPETGRLYAWINLLPRDSRYAPTQAEANRAAQAADGEMADIDTGELVRCKRPTWLLFPLEFGFDFHERRYLLAGKPGGGRLVYRPEEDRFELHASFTLTGPAADTGRRFLGVDRGIYNLAAWAVVDGDGRLIEDGSVSGLELRHMQRALEWRIKDLQRRRVKVLTRRIRRGLSRWCRRLLHLAPGQRPQVLLYRHGRPYPVS